jgi:hypothetical protein
MLRVREAYRLMTEKKEFTKEIMLRAADEIYFVPLFKNIFYGDQPLNIAVFIDNQTDFLFITLEFHQLGAERPRSLPTDDGEERVHKRDHAAGGR